MNDLRQEEVLARPFDIRLMARLLAYARPHARSLLLSVLILAVIIAAELARPLLLRAAVDGYILPARTDPGVVYLALGYFALIGASFGLSYWQTLLLQLAGQRIVLDIRDRAFRHLQHLSLAYFDRNPVGRLVTRVTNDPESLADMYTNVLVNLFRDVFVIVGVVAVMFRLNVRLALLSLSVLPVVALAATVYQRYARTAWRAVRARLAAINAALAETIAGMRVVQLLARERQQAAELAAANRAYFEASMRQLTVFAVFRPTLDLLASLALALVVWRGGNGLLSGDVTFGLVIAFASYVQRLFRPILELSEKFNILLQAMASSERIFQLLDEPVEVADPPQPVPLAGRARGRVEFDRVWFAYEDGHWVLEDVSFQAEPGQTVAFVGPTGAGKSSIINLLARFYDVQRGAIRLDGLDVREIRQSDLRRQLAVVQQDVFLFSGTVADNVRLREPKISDEQVAQAIRLVGAEPFVRQIGGLSAQVSERGSTFSTGQRQLLSFARALAFDPPILVLDEATAHVDSQTEQEIQRALATVSRGRTTLVIAHRLSTIQHADKIIVLHRGRIRESGTHRALLAEDGLYARLWRLQQAEAGKALEA